MNTETTITDEEAVGGPGAKGLHLLVMSPELFASHVLPSSGTVTIGRSSRCFVRIDDPVASREHVRLHLAIDSNAPALAVEDLGSANGTRVREAAISPGVLTPVVPGEGFLVGSTVIMVLHDRSPAGLRRLWSHVYFGARVQEECVRASRAKGLVALARLQFTGGAPWTKTLPILARSLVGPHGVAIYGPRDYEILLLDLQQEAAEGVVNELLEAFRASGINARGSVACFPKDGRSFDALMAEANAALRVPGGTTTLRDAAVPDFAGMKRVREMAARVASSQINVLILGETGVGKDVLARLIHGLSTRAGKPFLALNCAGLSETLLESELFGHAKGTFTGATANKVGLLASADGGTVFLDEVGDMPLPVQARLLRVIEDRQVRPLGAVTSRPVNIRFLAATNKALDDAVERGEFRQDLMFRLNGISLEIPPLRKRRDEIPLLAAGFLADICREMCRDPAPTLGSGAMEALTRHEWTGNIRELKNVIERAVVLCDGAEILPEHLDLRVSAGSTGLRITQEAPAARSKALPPLSDPQQLVERQKILDALEACASNQTRAAQLLGMPRRTFVSKLDLYRIPRPQKADLQGRPED